MRLKSIIALLLFCFATASWAVGEFQLSGKLRVLKPITIQLKDMNGNILLSCETRPDGTFNSEKTRLIPDIYKLCMGQTEQDLFMENTPLTISGYFDEQDPSHSSLSFTGIDEYLTIQDYIAQNANEGVIALTGKEKLTPATAAALGYLANVNDYTSGKKLLDMIPQQERNSNAAKWLIKKVEILSHQVKGALAPDFTFTDVNGKDVSLKDFRGKIVVLDFCASWCGPCRKEMQSLLGIYKELKADDLEFISVSLDDKEEKWKEMLKEENLPWVMLWDKAGFPKSSDHPNEIQTAYGFYSIPFLVVIDKEGRLVARNVRGVQVKEAILKARNN